MRLTQSRLRQLTTIAIIVVLSTTGGAVYGILVSQAAGGDAAIMLAGALRGGLTGFTISLLASVLEVFIVGGPLGRNLRQWPFLGYLAIKSLGYLVIIVLGLRLGQVLVPIDGDESTSASGWLQQILVSFLIGFVFTTILAINELLGPGVLGRLLAGRYHRPKSEERIFLIVDIRGSTRIAERIGDHAFLSFLDAAFYDITDPLLEQRAEIYKYVGDEIIATWRLADGLRDARCVRACFAAADRLQLYADAYRRLHGEVPAFRAALHAGPVVTGELGHVKREIAYLGDTLNTAARIEQECKTRDRFCLISGPLLEKLTLPEGIVATPIGETALAGRTALLPLFSLDKRAPGL